MIVVDFVSIFFIVATITLVRLCWSDWKHRVVKPDLSHYMIGVTSFIFLYLDAILYFIVYTILIVVGLSIIKQKIAHYEQKKDKIIIGAGDITVLSWIIPTLLILNINYLIIWVFIYCIGNIVMIGLLKHKAPGIIPMFIALIVTWISTLFF